MRVILWSFLICIPLISLSAQPPVKQPRPTPKIENSSVRSSAAYAEVLLRETELTAEIESLLLDYTDEYPRIKEIRSEIDLLSSELDRLMAVKAADSGKLTEALGKLILGKVANQSKLIQLRVQYADAHPNVKRQRRKVEVYEAAIKQILD